jgi:VWFA-related protein
VTALSISAQQPGQAGDTTGKLTVNANLVLVPAVVRDKHNAIVGNLGKTDFTLNVDGKPQTVRYFDHENDTPLTIGLLVDTSMSQRKVLDDERSASVAFLQKMLLPATATRVSDKAFVVQFARDVELLQDVTDSRPRLQEGLKQVDTESPQFRRPGDDSNNGNGNNGNSNGNNNDNRNDRGRGGRGQYGGGGGTALYDAVFLSSDEVISKQKGRRALILLTDGDDRGSKKSLTSAIESAQRADTVVYAIYFKGESPRSGGFGGPGMGGGRRGGGGWPGGGGGGYPGGGGRGDGRGDENRTDGKKVLERMCGETGGRVFEVKGKETVDAIYTEIGEELRAQYRLGFTPAAEATAEGYHQIALDIAGPRAKDKLMVQTRDGYYTGSK